MGLKDLHLKFKAFRLKKLIIARDGPKSKKANVKKASWMMPISHGYHVVLNGNNSTESGNSNIDSVVVQQEQLEDQELWYFGVFDHKISDGVVNYLQSHLFHKKVRVTELRMKSKETIKKAFLGERAKAKAKENIGAASVIVINRDKLVISNMGEFRAVVCRNGDAFLISPISHQAKKQHWSCKLISGAIRMHTVKFLACEFGHEIRSKASSSSKLVVGSQRIDNETDIVILASSGIWDVMRHQEAVSLIRHIDDPQEASECLVKEALTRMSRRNISCLVIRFD